MPLRERIALPDETVAAGAAPPGTDTRRAARLSRRDRLGGTEGNEILTSATAAVLTVLLVAEGTTILRMRGLVSVHMFVGMLLIPPVLLKLASTGYRFVRYYTGARTYREKGPPPLPLRLLAPVLVASTAGVFVTGVWLLLLGRRSDQLPLLHKITFIVWGVMFAIHFLAYLPRVLVAGRLGCGPAPSGSGDRASWNARRCVARSRSRARAVAAKRHCGLARRSPPLGHDGLLGRGRQPRWIASPSRLVQRSCRENVGIGCSLWTFPSCSSSSASCWLSS